MLIVTPLSGSGIVPSREPATLQVPAPPRTPRQPRRGAKQASGGRAALCLHGRAGDKKIARSLIHHFATPLDADIFALVNCESYFHWTGPFAQNSTDDDCSKPPPQYLTNELNKTGRLVRIVHWADDNVTMARMARDIKRGSWSAFRAFAMRAYLDQNNHNTCEDIIYAHERIHGFQYSILAHSRLDLMLFGGPPPATVRPGEPWRTRAEREPQIPHVFKPDGDDHNGVIDIMTVANRKGFQTCAGVRDLITAGGRPFNQVQQMYDAPGLVFPEQFTASQLHAANATLVRGKWAQCRVDSSGACRYPGEAARMLFEHPDLAVQSPMPVCAEVATHYALLKKEETCCAGSIGNYQTSPDRERILVRWPDMSYPEYLFDLFTRPFTFFGSIFSPGHRCDHSNGWKGSFACNSSFEDAHCCTISSACEDLLSGRTASALETRRAFLSRDKEARHGSVSDVA